MTPGEKAAAAAVLIEEQVASILAEEDLVVDPLPRAFAELGWDSLSVVELQYRLQRALGCKLSPEVFEVTDLDALATSIVVELDEQGIWPSVLS